METQTYTIVEVYDGSNDFILQFLKEIENKIQYVRVCVQYGHKRLNIEQYKCTHRGIGNTVNSRYLEVVGTIFYKFKLPEVQINLLFG